MAHPGQFGSRGNMWAAIKEAFNYGFQAFMPFARDNGMGLVGNAKMTYDFTVDGGAIGTITPLNSPKLPAGAIILGGVIDVTTSLASGGAATVALGLGSGAQVGSFRSATALGYAAGTTTPIGPIFTSATYVKVAAETQMTITVAAFALTAGRMDVNLVYVMGNV